MSVVFLNTKEIFKDSSTIVREIIVCYTFSEINYFIYLHIHMYVCA